MWEVGVEAESPKALKPARLGSSSVWWKDGEHTQEVGSWLMSPEVWGVGPSSHLLYIREADTISIE